MKGFRRRGDNRGIAYRTNYGQTPLDLRLSHSGSRTKDFLVWFFPRQIEFMSEGIGTTALPTSSAGSPVRVYVDAARLMQSAAQPQASSLANYEASSYEDNINGKRIDINQHLVVYVVKNGLIRVLHRHTPMKSLLRAHKDQRVTDIQFFQDGDVLATVGGPPPEKNGQGLPSIVVIWRVFERSPEISSEMLLEIRTTKFAISRVIWHPFNPNQFWMIHANEQGRVVATLVDTTKVTTKRHPTAAHPVCECADFLITSGAIQLKSENGDLTDLTWNTRDTRHVLTTHSSGEIILWDMTQQTPDRSNGSLQPKRLITVKEDFPVTRAVFLPHEHLAAPSLDKAISSSKSLTTCFVTGSANNSALTLWSPFSQDGSEPQRGQIIELQDPPTSCLIDVVFGQAPPNASPPSSFIVVADRSAGSIWAFHCRAAWDQSGTQQRPLLVGADYVVPFKTLHPTFSWTVVASPTTDITEEELQEQGGLIFDTKIFAYQSKLVQCLTLTSYMCLPPESTWTDPTPGVRVQRVFPVHSAHVSEVGSDNGDNVLEYDEEYDIGDDDDGDVDGEEYDGAPDPSTLPPPNGMVPNGAPPGLISGNLNAGNPFSNWLGALAAKPPAASADGLPPAEGPPASSLPKPTHSPATLLSPSEFSSAPAAPEPQESKPKKSSSKSKPGDGSNKKGATSKPPSDGITILKREEGPKVPSKPPEPTHVPPPVPAPYVVPSSSGPPGDDDIRQTIRQEIQSMVPELTRSIQDSLKPVILEAVQRSSQDISSGRGGTTDQDALISGVTEAIDEPFRQAFAHNMKAVLVPSIEAITGQVLKQVSGSLEKFEARNYSDNSEVQKMSTQVDSLTGMVEKLSTEVSALRSSLSQQRQQTPNTAPTPPVTNDAEVLKAEVKALLQEKKFDAAFTKAVSASTADMAVFCCTHADISEVLGAEPVRLTQPILLCLMQQLGTVVGSSKQNLQVELDWLQDIALSLEPSDKRIQMHIPRVLEQLDAQINARLSRGDTALRRPLQKLHTMIRGIRLEK